MHAGVWTSREGLGWSPMGQELWPWVSMGGNTPGRPRVGDGDDGFRQLCRFVERSLNAVRGGVLGEPAMATREPKSSGLSGSGRERPAQPPLGLAMRWSLED